MCKKYFYLQLAVKQDTNLTPHYVFVVCYLDLTIQHGKSTLFSDETSQISDFLFSPLMHHQLLQEAEPVLPFIVHTKAF